MNRIGLALTGLLLIGLAGLVQSADKKGGDKKPTISKDKLIGVWEGKTLIGESITLEFKKGDMIKLNVRSGDGTVEIAGTFELKDDKLTMVYKVNGVERNDSSTIKTLDADRLELAYKSGGELKLTRKKDKDKKDKK